MRPEQLLPAPDSLKDLGMHSSLEFLIHQQSRDLEQKFFGGYLTEECEFTPIGEVLHEIEAIVEHFFVLEAEAFRDAIDGMFGPRCKKKVHVYSRVDEVEDALVLSHGRLLVGIIGGLLDQHAQLLQHFHLNQIKCISNMIRSGRRIIRHCCGCSFLINST